MVAVPSNSIVFLVAVAVLLAEAVLLAAAVSGNNIRISRTAVRRLARGECLLDWLIIMRLVYVLKLSLALVTGGYGWRYSDTLTVVSRGKAINLKGSQRGERSPAWCASGRRAIAVGGAVSAGRKPGPFLKCAGKRAALGEAQQLGNFVNSQLLFQQLFNGGIAAQIIF